MNKYQGKKYDGACGSKTLKPATTAHPAPANQINIKRSNATGSGKAGK